MKNFETTHFLKAYLSVTDDPLDFLQTEAVLDAFRDSHGFRTLALALIWTLHKLPSF